MKRTLYATAASLLLLAATACSHPYGMGPGEPGGYGGYGTGPGMMGGHGGYGTGPGMMGGYGHGGPGGRGMGPGMMWQHGGPGDMRALDLSADQRKKIDEIMEETSKAHWALMGTMHQQDFHMHRRFGPGALDEQEARKAFQAMSDAHKAMFELNLEARKRIDAVLTAEQRAKLRGN